MGKVFPSCSSTRSHHIFKTPSTGEVCSRRTKLWAGLQTQFSIQELITERYISFMIIEKSPSSQWRRNSNVNTSSGSHRKNQTRGDRTNKNTHRYEQKCQSHTCSGTINSSMYDSALTTTTSLWVHQLPIVGKGQWQAPTYELSFCCNSGSNEKTQPYYWIATDHNNKDKTKKQRMTEREKKN
jgi:hypothetical protein